MVRKTLPAIFWLLVLPLAVFSQNKPDSLLSELEKAIHDTTKVNILNDLIFELSPYNQEQALKFSEQSIALAKKAGYRKGLATAYHNTGNVFFYMTKNQEALKQYFKSIEIKQEMLAQEPEIRSMKKEISSSYNNVANVYVYMGKLDKALEYNYKSLKINQQINDSTGVAYSYYGIGSVLDNQGKYLEAIEAYNKALSIFKAQNDKKHIASTYNTIGIIFNNQGNYDQALEYYFRSLVLQEEIAEEFPNDKINQNDIARSYNNIGIILAKQENHEKALEYYNRSLAIKQKLGDKRGIADAYNNIGNVYHAISNKGQGDYSKALEYFFKSLQIHQELGNQSGIANSYYNIGLIYKNQGLYDKAIEYFVNSLDIRQKIGDKFGIAFSNNGIGESYNQLGQYAKALPFLRKGIEIGREIQSHEVMKISANELSQSYAELRQYKQAYEYQVLFKQMSDSLRNEENTRKITKLSMQYQFDKQIRQQEFEQKQKDLANQARLKRQKIYTGIFIAGFLIMILFAFVVFRSYRQKQRDNLKLAAQREEILLKNGELEQQKEEILAQRDEIERQRDYVTKQRDQISRQKQAITDSILYASRIQNAILPPDEFVKKILPQNFIFFKPRDIVSGDFYWLTQKDEQIVVAAADCTGHGVPGAFMSMLGVSFLNEIVNKHPLHHAHLVLNKLRNEVKKSLRQTGKENEAKDGMDIALCIIDQKTLKLQYAGAYNPLYIVRKNGSESQSFDFEGGKRLKKSGFELMQISADRMPIGIFLREKDSFTNHEIQLQPGDTLYIFSDGYVDQFGGKNGRKFMSKPFKKLLLGLQHLPMSEQKSILEEKLQEWQGAEHEQVDDILVIGIRV